MSEPKETVTATNGHDADHISSDEEHKNDFRDDTDRNASFSSQKEAADYERKKANAILANPLRGYSHAQLRKMGQDYAMEHALVEPEDLRAFEIGACLAQNAKAWESVEGLREEEREILARELSSRVSISVTRTIPGVSDV